MSKSVQHGVIGIAFVGLGKKGTSGCGALVQFVR
jgi:hypothetical protein